MPVGILVTERRESRMSFCWRFLRPLMWLMICSGESSTNWQRVFKVLTPASHRSLFGLSNVG